MTEQQPMGRRRAVQLVGAVGAAGAGAAILAAGAAGGQANAAGKLPSIVGTWVISSPGPSMRLLQTYNADGTHLSVHDEHPTRSPQLGVWEQVGEREFLMRNLSLRFDDDGVQNGSIDVRASYTVEQSGATMRGHGVRLELDLEGNLLQPPIVWESAATRVAPIPLD